MNKNIGIISFTVVFIKSNQNQLIRIIFLGYIKINVDISKENNKNNKNAHRGARTHDH